MVKKPAQPPVITDPMAFIRGAADTPAPVVIGEKATEIERPAPTPQRKRAPKPVSKHEPEKMPWEDANPKIRNNVQVRMPEPLGLKLKWIKENSLGVPSVHELILKTLEAMADQRIKEIQKGQGGK